MRSVVVSHRSAQAPSAPVLSETTSSIMRPTAIILGLVAATTAAVLPAGPEHLPLGEIGWEGVVIPGEPAVEVWGWSFEVD